MKNNHKQFTNLLKLGILLFGFSLLLYNCEQDELVEKSESNYLVQKVAFKEFKNNNELVKKVRFLEENIKNNTKNKAKNSTGNEVINLNLKEVIYIENKEKKHHSYTFYIENDEDKYTIKNMILSQNKKGSYEAFLATYQITEKDRVLISQGKTFNPKGKLSITPFNIANINLASRRSCEWKKVSVRREVACSIDGCWESEYTTWISVSEWVEVCSEVSEGSGGSEGAGPGGGGGTSGGGSTIPVDTSISIPPIRPDKDDKCPDGFVKNLATGNCDPICKGVKIYNPITKNCDCPEGTTENTLGKCVPDPCKILKTQLGNLNYKNKINELKKKTGLKKETGYKQNKDGNYTALPQTTNGHSASFNTDRNTRGYMHTHLNDFETGRIVNGLTEEIKPIRIFSPKDVLQFLQLVKYSRFNGVPTHLVYGTLISSTGNYTLTFTGDVNFDASGLKEARDYDAGYEKYFTKKYKNNVQKAFLHFLKEKIKIDGINLYRIKNNGDLEKKTLKTNGKVETNDCE
ncbi:hypothetical protein DS884_11040 [Tenacibaculum sp. E3R01]|uniref:hypothetical protein n=1 Tax=Tenacibaculum sp. E3R01 TaxID=2267227 RepID=UPI000DEB38C7|nr:hypothetical protein [Tenacibaculum sp. E3R01]RBW57581.1 hypothetical protein DS884_11040 [Tenacibaculum sp. E3R01]